MRSPTDPFFTAAAELLVDAAWLRVALADGIPPAVLDVRWRLNGSPGRDDFDAGHVPGAAFVDLETDLAGAVRPDGSGGRHPLPTAAAFQASMRRAGVSASRTVVVVDDGDGVAAARAWWCLRYFGHPDVRILEGGWRSWVAAGGATTDEMSVGEPGDFEAVPGGLPVADAEGAAAAARGPGNLLDLRTAVRFRGEQEPVDPVAGHVPGALNLPAAQLVVDDAWLAVDQLRDRVRAAGAGDDGPVVASCGSGVTAALLIAALARAGEEAVLYAGSWSDWISDPTRPVALGD